MASDATTSAPIKMDSAAEASGAAAEASASATETRHGSNGHKERGNRDRGGRGDRGGKRGGHGNSDRGNDKKRKGFGSHKADGAQVRDRVHENRANKRKKVIEEGNDGKSFASIPFSAEEIAAEERRPKRKVAVLIGYAGTGYHGLQINHGEKSIEGDLFAAFVKTGMISKANADDPKKSSLTRCARTDKGVHAAGNVLSLKLIIEDKDMLEKVNAELPPQIRVWGIQRTSNGFSAYQQCESRWYEYLMPSYALLPPRPQSYLGKTIARSTEEKGVTAEYMERLSDVKDFWDEVDKNEIQPILEKLDPETRAKTMKILSLEGSQSQEDAQETTETVSEGGASSKIERGAEEDRMEVDNAGTEELIEAPETSDDSNDKAGSSADKEDDMQPKKEGRKLTPAQEAAREIKAAIVAAKRRYRATPTRIQKLQEALNLYLGTHNYHNYTILKAFKDPSSRRHVKSFVVNPKPIPIRDTEWLSLKVHGQSFMMHQIRKMVAMAVMLVRCGAPLSTIQESYGPRRISIPKAPSLGLMLERPVFDGYNRRAPDLDREPVDFSKYDDKIQEFKEQEIYRRMFETEEEENAFHVFFHQLDNFQVDYFHWVTAGGIECAHERSDRVLEERKSIPKGLEEELGDDPDGVEEAD